MKDRLQILIIPKKIGKCCSKSGRGICNSSGTDHHDMFHFLTLAVALCLGAEWVRAAGGSLGAVQSLWASGEGEVGDGALAGLRLEALGEISPRTSLSSSGKWVRCLLPLRNSVRVDLS